MYKPMSLEDELGNEDEGRCREEGEKRGRGGGGGDRGH